MPQREQWRWWQRAAGNIATCTEKDTNLYKRLHRRLLYMLFLGRRGTHTYLSRGATLLVLIEIDYIDLIYDCGCE